MFGGTGSYFWLDSWVMANIVQLGTQEFCGLCFSTAGTTPADDNTTR